MRKVQKKYREVTAESFRKWSLELSDVAIERKGQGHKVQMVPNPFCAFRYTEDEQYLSGDGRRMETSTPKPRKANVNFRDVAVKSTKNYRKQETLRVVTLRTTRDSEKLFEDYDKKYRLGQSSFRDLFENSKQKKPGSLTA